jgi:predicted MFS family arabinose efflux permease
LGVTQTLAWATTYYIPATVIGAAAETLDVSRTVLLGGFSWSLLVAGLCSPRIGRYIDAHGGRPVLAAGALVTCLGLALLASAGGVATWYVAWTVLGLGMAMGLYDTAFATIGRLLGDAARPAIIGVTFMAGFASTIGWPVGTWLVAQHGWRAAVWIFAAVQVAAILPVVLAFVPAAAAVPPPAAARTPAPGGPLPGTIFALLAVFFTARAAISSLVAVHALVLLTGIGLNLGQAVFTASMIGPAQVAARLLDWRLSRWLSPVASSLVGGVLLPLGVLAVLAGAPALVFALAYGMSNGILTISRGALPLHVFGPAGYATLLGRLAMPGLIAQAAAPTLLAPLVDIWPASWILGGIGVLSLSAIACLIPLRAR